MIDRHEDHDQAAQCVQGEEPLAHGLGRDGLILWPRFVQRSLPPHRGAAPDQADHHQQVAGRRVED